MNMVWRMISINLNRMNRTFKEETGIKRMEVLKRKNKKGRTRRRDKYHKKSIITMPTIKGKHSRGSNE